MHRDVNDAMRDGRCRASAALRRRPARRIPHVGVANFAAARFVGARIAFGMRCAMPAAAYR
jgi:hypothetical protein